MVDKILSKDKNYNSHVSRVTEMEIRMEILKKDISTLEDEYQQLKNDCKNIYIIFYIIFYNFYCVFIYISH